MRQTVHFLNEACVFSDLMHICFLPHARGVQSRDTSAIPQLFRLVDRPTSKVSQLQIAAVVAEETLLQALLPAYCGTERAFREGAYSGESNAGGQQAALD